MSENTNSAGMSQLQRLKALQEENKAKSQKANMTAFNNLIGVYVGTPAREHFPKIKDENGKLLKMREDAIYVVTSLMDTLIHLVSLVLLK